MSSTKYGEPANIPIGMVFENRRAVYNAGLHRYLMNGISGSSKEAADAIVLSGGYEDDQDYDDLIIYTGEGGNDPKTKKQVADQPMTGGNLALVKSLMNGIPVRVIRGAHHKSRFSPAQGYCYAGLYAIDAYWQEVGRSGYRIWRYRLKRLEMLEETASSIHEEKPLYGDAPPTDRRQTTVSRVIRNTMMSSRVKTLHDYHCQMCGTQLLTPVGPYAEGAHIRPLGIPHNGPDTPDNILCLCPNCHILFDLGAVTINEDFSLNGLAGTLRTLPEHPLNSEHVTYHREHCASGDR